MVGRGLVVVPKLIHPLPPPLQSPETSPERVIEDTWMQVKVFSSLPVDTNLDNQFYFLSSISFCMFMVYCRSLIFRDHPLLPVVAPSLTLTETPLHIYDIPDSRMFVFLVLDNLEEKKKRK